MTIDEVKEELKRYADDCKMIDDFEKEVEIYNSKILSCTAQLNDTSGSGTGIKDKIAEYIAKLEDLKAEKYARLIEVENRKELVEKTIAHIKQPYARLLFITYIQEWECKDERGKTRIEIGHKLNLTGYIMGYSYKHICKLHGRALQEYLKVREELYV